jgi:hypothetical protein
MRRLISRSAFIFIWLVASIFPVGGAVAQETQMGTAVFDQIALGLEVISLSSPESTQEELPGMGHKFELIGAMMDAKDPDNPTNDTISLTATAVGLAFRNLPPGIKIAALDNQLGLKYFFIGARSCFGGSPRITLLVDSDGDGNFNFAAHGHVNPPLFAGCPPNQWVYENLTDNLKRWEVTPATAVTPACGPVGGPTTCTWEELEARITLQFPNHKILSGFLLDGESCSFFAPNTPEFACGQAHYDLVTIENRTLENKQDTVRNNK